MRKQIVLNTGLPKSSTHSPLALHAFFLLLIMASIAFSQSSFAQTTTPAATVSPTATPTASPAEPDETAADTQKHTVEFEGDLRLDNDINPDENGKNDYNMRFQKFELQARVKVPKFLPDSIAREILFMVRSQMEQNVYINGILKANHLTATQYLKEAYLEFKNVGGLPVVVIVGTSEIAYGQDFHGMIDYQNDASHGMTDPDQGQVKGFTIILDQKIGPLIDKVEANFFTSNPAVANLSLRHLDGFAFRASKNISEDLTAEVSVMRKANGFGPELQPETKYSFGGVYRHGIWTFFGEGIKMSNSARYPDAPYGATLGAHRITGPGQFDLEATGIRKTLQQYSLGYELFISQKWAVGPVFRYTFCAGGNAGCASLRNYGQGPSFGVSVRYRFGSTEGANPTWLGSKSKSVLVRKIFSSRSRYQRD